MFVHLHVHSEYSIVDGIVSIDPLIEKVVHSRMPAVAITDQCNLYAMVKFYKAALAAGVKPIIGSDIWLHNEQEPAKPFRLTLLSQNTLGYRHLTQLLSKSYTEGQMHGLPVVHPSWLKDKTEGLIALSGGVHGDIGHALIAKHSDQAVQYLQQWLHLFGDRFYLELVRTGREYEEIFNQAALDLAEKFSIPVVATNDVRFLQSDDFEAHEARVCIHGGWVLEDHRRPHAYSEQQYLRTPQEMSELFADIPEAIANTAEIAKRCSLDLKLGKVFLPNFPIPENKTTEEFFEEESINGLEKRLKDLNILDQETREGYFTRLNLEINVIKQMGFTGYFLIVADFVQWSKNNGIPVGPGRGSGAGSLVAYSLGITDLDPIGHELLFERFLNPERVSMPDFDIDFCMEGRDRVIDYVAAKYGKESVSQIITFGTMAARAVVRDVGRVLGYPYGFVDKLAKLIPFELGMTLEKALDDEEQLRQRYEQEAEVKTLIDLALKLEGVPRNVGKHAGGVVIAPSVLTDFTPLYCEPSGENRVSQFDKDDVEAVGLVKFDFLGLRTLTIIDWALQNINAKRKSENLAELDIAKIPLDDAKTYELLKACTTTAVFQLESRGMKDLIKRLQPDCFDDIVALVALFRPGPLQSGMVDDYINRKHGRARVEYPHAILEPILRPTYGVILYQEQVMQIAQVLAGYTLGGADILRRAMGKKKAEEMAKQREIFVQGATTQQIDEKKSNQIFDLMEKFADYGFNKSHSAAYALLAYQTAWLKTHYPAEFMAAVLSSDMDNTDKIVRFLDDAKEIGLQIIAPHINQSDYQFTVNEQGQIMYGLGAIKGVGQAAVEILLAERRQNGEFKDLFEFCRRLDTRKVNRKVIEALISSGAMDCFDIHRASLAASIDTALQGAEQFSRNQSIGQNDLFGLIETNESQKTVHYVAVEPWPSAEQLAGEKETLGWYLSGHPILQYQHELAYFVSAKLCDLEYIRDSNIVVAGHIAAIKVLQTKSGARMAIVTLEDQSGKVDTVVFSDVFNQSREWLVKDQLLIVEGQLSLDDFSGEFRLTAKDVYDLTMARQKYGSKLKISLQNEQVAHGLFDQLYKLLQRFRGGCCAVIIEYQQNSASASLQLGKEWSVKPSDELLNHLGMMIGEANVSLMYETAS